MAICCWKVGKVRTKADICCYGSTPHTDTIHQLIDIKGISLTLFCNNAFEVVCKSMKRTFLCAHIFAYYRHKLKSAQKSFFFLIGKA